MSHATFESALLPGNIRQFVEKLVAPSLTADSTIQRTQTHNTAAEDSSMLTIVGGMDIYMGIYGYRRGGNAYTTVSADLSGLRAVTVHFFC